MSTQNNILATILERKRAEVAERKQLFPTALLERSEYFKTPTVSLARYIRRADKHGIIAEFKRKSPSKGVINKYASVDQVSVGYMQSGASALSILTDTDFFGGSLNDLKSARKYNYCPILRKDFIIDEYQIVEARSHGADAILLIASALTPEQTRVLAECAHGLQMEVLLEVHSQEELNSHIHPLVHLVGVNSRNLSTFETSLDIAHALVEHIPDEFTAIAESGLRTPADVLALRNAGYHGFLIGETFMRHVRPEVQCKEFIQELARHSMQSTTTQSRAQAA